MICPFLNSRCVEADCVMWLDSQCMITALARSLLVNRTVVVPCESREPKDILAATAQHFKRPNIASLSRREIEDYLAAANIVVDSSQRRTLLRTWRDIRRIEKERRNTNPDEWKSRNSNQGKAWSSSEDEDIKQSHADGLTVKQLATKHKRSEVAVRYRLERFGLLTGEIEAEQAPSPYSSPAAGSESGEA